MFHLDHLCLGVRDLAEGVRRVHEETGLAYYDGGVFAGGIANTIFPLGEDVYLEVEAATGPIAERAPAAQWFDGVVAGGDRWMFWSLRADTLEEMAAVAQRLGGEVARRPGRVQPDGTQRVITTAPGPDRGLDTCWRRGLPNWFHRADPATNPDRGATGHGDRGVAVTRLEIAADAAELRAHIGAETVDRLPLELVAGRPGVHAVTVRTASGREVTLRRDPADL
ncbi:VOC family protein [Amycolatopsis saalfeldensis]|uniref:Glyoxalase-like domain-containing protein n=1 Tax=Amycolatopsis saalfeldensis TaxID=394193 RepID=A0A1H8XDP3_9PSEU|nr:VOC family protein [Amycolatopsis saalfeldensis]SEP38134.1 Glyoxalase-like domain-containing protein [Amycolatopsis saalfeldensis]